MRSSVILKNSSLRKDLSVKWGEGGDTHLIETFLKRFVGNMHGGRNFGVKTHLIAAFFEGSIRNMEGRGGGGIEINISFSLAGSSFFKRLIGKIRWGGRRGGRNLV